MGWKHDKMRRKGEGCLRSEEEMRTLILAVAQEIGAKAVALSGSRVNPCVPKDDFQDYDIVYVVENKTELLENRAWLKRFGEILVSQRPGEMTLFPSTLGERFTFLMLFKDGNRIDLTLCPLSFVEQWRVEEPLFQVLADPENILQPAPQLTDEIYRTQVPSEAMFQDCCNEFWWVTTYVVKGLVRHEQTYTVDHLYGICHQELLRLLSWQVVRQQGLVNVGKNYKYLFTYLDAAYKQKFQSLLDFSSESNIAQSLLATQRFFHEEAQLYATQTKVSYDKVTAENVIAYTQKWMNS